MIPGMNALNNAKWPQYPNIYEINTWVWLSELSQRSNSRIDLNGVNPQVWDAIGSLGFDSVWLMGVWERSPAGIEIANANPALRAEFERVLPDFAPEDNVGSPYCIRNYHVDRRLGGDEGLALARRALAERGMRLILDFVPNHVAPDHDWAREHPEYFIQGSKQDLANDPAGFMEREGTVFARGRDPYFPPWPDVLQINAFEPRLRSAVIETISRIATQCDGIRCDMAMLFLNAIFERTWTFRAGPPPTSEYWEDVIHALKSSHPDFLFIAEAYWDLEWELQQKGFDFCYDKRLYDRLKSENAESVRLHLCADPAYQDKLLRFLENHDEPRAASEFPEPKLRAAAITTATQTGARLFHEGQFEGRKVKLPVFLGRRPAEIVDVELQDFYRKLLKIINAAASGESDWKLCERSGWPDNSSFENIVAWSWASPEQRYLVIVNLSPRSAQAQVHLPWSDLGGRVFHLEDQLSGARFDRDGNQMQSPGLYVDLGPWNYHVLQCKPV